MRKRKETGTIQSKCQQKEEGRLSVTDSSGLGAQGWAVPRRPVTDLSDPVPCLPSTGPLCYGSILFPT